MKFSLASIVLPLLAAAAPVELEERQAAGCAEVAVFYARGTGDPGVNGVVVGPALEKNLKSALGSKMSYTPIPYSAGVSGDIPGGQQPGTTAYLNQIKEKTASCPQTKIVLSGYSQGGWLVHTTARQLGKPIAAAVTFGDPFKGGTPQGCAPEHYKTFCQIGDPVCGEGVNIASHLSYASQTGQAAQFIKQAVGA
ncbi:MAG: hypothetical protein Q9159_001399 [Coniocarpon cinnabarinum]